MKFYQVAQRIHAIIKIQHFIRRIKPRNDTCSISLEPLQPPIFRYYPASSDHKCRPIGYSLRSILQHLKTLDSNSEDDDGNNKWPRDPCTRQLLKWNDITRILVLARVYKLDTNSPLKWLRRIEDLETAATLFHRLFTTHPHDIVDYIMTRHIKPRIDLCLATIEALADIAPNRARNLALQLATVKSDECGNIYADLASKWAENAIDKFVTHLHQLGQEP